MKLGEMGKAEEYLAAFTDKHANIYSKAMFLELQKLKWFVYYFLVKDAWAILDLVFTLMNIVFPTVGRLLPHLDLLITRRKRQNYLRLLPC